MRASNEPLYRSDRLPVPPVGHVWVEWVGEASPLDDPVVGFNLITNRYTDDQKKMIRYLARHRVARVHGHKRFLHTGNGMGQIPHLSRSWKWGPKQQTRPGEPGSFCQAVPFADADKIKSSSVGHQFVIHNERDGEQVSTLTLPRTTTVVEVGRTDYQTFGSFKRGMGWS